MYYMITVNINHKNLLKRDLTMKKFITTSVALAALLTTAQADFDFGDMFKDMKEAAISMSKDAKDSVVKYERWCS